MNAKKTRGWWTAGLIAGALLGFPAVLAAQEPVKTFDQLVTRLKAGDTVYKGGPFPAAELRELDQRVPDSLCRECADAPVGGTPSQPDGEGRRRPDLVLRLGVAVRSPRRARRAGAAHAIRACAGA